MTEDEEEKKAEAELLRQRRMRYRREVDHGDGRPGVGSDKYEIVYMPPPAPSTRSLLDLRR